VGGQSRHFDRRDPLRQRVLDGGIWHEGEHREGDDLVHGDPHPTNMIFSMFRRPTGLIDFELATLGPGIWNLMSLIFTWAPLEPLSLTRWRDAPVRCPRERIQTILRHWHARASAQELVEACHDFIRWRKNWIRTLAVMGNPGARSFVADQDFDCRYAHAIEVMTSVSTA
jgi:aminoglycoside/choline kinase family phosphotransferase